MPTPITFDGVNVVIAENQEPYLPLPAQVFGDSMGTILTCWEFSEEEMEEFLRTRKLWISHWSFNQLFQPLSLSTERPVVNTSPATVLFLFGFPAEFIGADPNSGEKGYSSL